MLNHQSFTSPDVQHISRTFTESRLRAALRQPRDSLPAAEKRIRRWIDGKFVSVAV